MLTGTTFSLQINEKIGHDYSAYFDPARANDIIKEAFIKAIEVKYQDITKEKNTDEISSLIVTNLAISLTSNSVPLSGIASYLHTLAIKTRFSKPLANVKAASNTRPIVLTLNSLTNLRDGDLIFVSGVLGNTNANGFRYVKTLYNDFANANFTVQLFSDAFLTTPIAGNGTYTRGGSVSVIIESWAKKKESYRKYSSFGEASLEDPYWEENTNTIKVLPDNYTCSQIYIDYIKTPPVYPDVNDNSFDLETVYPLRFLYFLEDETARLMGEYSRDGEQVANSSQELLQP